MSNNINEDILPLPPVAAEGASPTARKAAAKKVAAKKVAKKAVAKKAAAKKTVPGKAAPAGETPAMVTTPAVKIPREKKIAAAAPLDAPTPAAPPGDLFDAPQRQSPARKPNRLFGRVPGGGPTTARDSTPEEGSRPATVVSPQSPSLPENPPPGAPAQIEANSHSPHENQALDSSVKPTPPTESRSKRRREKRKRRNNERNEQGGPQPNNRQGGQQGNFQGNHKNNQRKRHEPNNGRQNPNDFDDRRPSQLDGPKIEANGMLELAPKGFGFLRVPQKNFEQARDDVFVSPEIIRKFNLRLGQWIHGLYQEGQRGPQLVEITTINDLTPEESAKLPHFDELKAINPTRRISFETTPERFTTRVIDIMSPVGRGQRGLIVSPPRSGKTTLLLHMAEAIREKYDEAIHLMVVLVDERPEEVTEFRRALPGAEIYASSNDEQARNHCRIAELAIERAKRLVEAGKDVFLLMDSITRLARAYNGNMNNHGRGTGSGGITIGALEIPRRLFAAARNTRGGGSLTILATALIQTNSRADEAIFMEFKGTGNMELVLDRKIAENYIYPAVDIFKSGTRREELLLADHMLHKIHLIRRGLAGHRPAEAMERLLFFLKKFPNNPQMLMEIKG